jgi:FkbM family methyltransferase
MSRLRWRLVVLISRWRNRFRYLLAAPRVYRNWWAWLLPKFGVGVVLELRNGLRYYIRPRTTDLAVVNEAAVLNPYLGPGYVRLRPDATVVDVGANIGDFTLQAAAACPEGRVYAIEPLSENACAVDFNRRLNGFSNVHVLQMALGAREGEVQIGADGSHSSTHFGVTGGTCQTVRLTTLAQVMREQGLAQIDLLKLDCEGAEWEILPSSDDVLPRISQICMEFHRDGDWTEERLAAWLRERGYEVRHTQGGWNGLLWATRVHAARTVCR